MRDTKFIFTCHNKPTFRIPNFFKKNISGPVKSHYINVNSHLVLILCIYHLYDVRVIDYFATINVNSNYNRPDESSVNLCSQFLLYISVIRGRTYYQFSSVLGTLTKPIFISLLKKYWKYWFQVYAFRLGRVRSYSDTVRLPHSPYNCAVTPGVIHYTYYFRKIFHLC
jgi:hypothetical protein